MSDYERYGDYDRDETEEDVAPPHHPIVVWLLRIARVLAIFSLFAICGILLFRVIYAEYYPKGMKDLYYTDYLADYVSENGSPAYFTQELAAPFEDSVHGYFYADQLVFSEEAGILQITVRLNKSAIRDIAAAYHLEGFAFGSKAFSFVLEDNAAYAQDHPESVLGQPDGTVQGTPHTYTPSEILTDSTFLYHYVKLCFDDVTFEDVSWMRLKIYIDGVTYAADESDLDAICVYENNERFSVREPYILKKREEYIGA
jgi:hypothetical protein